MKAFEWANASSVDEAVKLLKPADPVADPDDLPRPIGGGQDLLTTMKEYLQRPPRVVNLKTIKGLDAIQPDGKGGLRIGATVTLDALENNPDVKAKFPGLAEAAHSIATPQIRHVGTVGGNLCQRPRCWYYRLESVVCRKKGGTVCYANLGQNKYNAIFDTGPSKIVHPSDLATMLVALGATATIAGPAAPRTIPLEEFFIKPSEDVRRENILKSDELITEIQIPAPVGRSVYVKFKERDSLDFAMVAAAVAADVGPDQTVRSARLVLGGVAAIPWRVPDAEKFLIGKKLTEENTAKTAQLALEGAEPLEFNGYKVDLAQVILRRALAKFTA